MAKRVSSLLFLLFLAVPVSTLSQGDPDNSTQDTTVAEQPRPIAVINVITEMEQVIDKLEDVGNQIRPRRSLVNIDSLYPEYLILFEERKERVTNLLESNPSRQQVDNSIVKWRGYRAYLRSWITAINSYLNRNSILDDEVASREEVWNLTYDNAVENDAPERTIANIEEIRAEITDIRSDINDRNSHYLQRESDISELIAEVNNVIAQLELMRESEVFDLLYQRNRPLWKSFTGADEQAVDQSIGLETYSDNMAAIEEFVQSSENKLYLYILLVAIVVGVVVLVRKAYVLYEFQTTLESLRDARDAVVSKPYWIAQFVAVLVFLILFPEIPKILEDVTLLLMLLTATLIIRPYVHPKFKMVPIWIILIVIIHNLKYYMGMSVLQYRFYLMAEAMVLVGLLVYYIHPYTQTRLMPMGRISQLLLRLTPVLFLIALSVVVANLLGYTNLAVFAMKVASQGTDLSLSFFALVLVADGLLIGLLHHRLSKRTLVDPLKKIALESKLNRIIRIAAGLFWTYYFLALVDLYRPISEWVNQFLAAPYKVGTTTFTLGMLVSFIGILAISFAITSLISFLLDGKEVRTSFLSLPKGIPSAISMVIRYFILAVGFVLAISSLGIDLSKFNLMAGALGLGIGFGLQTVVSNFISGIILVFERPILPGDVVEVNKLLGTVNKIGVRASRISTFDGSEVVVPNNNLISHDLINWTLSNNIRRLEILVGTSYGTDPNLVLEAMKEVTANHPLVLDNPPPLALFLEFGESSLNFRLLFWINIQNVLTARSEVSIALYNRFKELGIQIPFPQRVVHLPKEKGDE